MSSLSKQWRCRTLRVAAVCFTYLYPGGPCNLTRVSQWPGQPRRKTESKIPSLVYYEASGRPQAFGAECLQTEIQDQAEDERWTLAKHFKLSLHPDSMRSKNNIKLDELPRGVPVSQIYTDFMEYLIPQLE